MPAAAWCPNLLRTRPRPLISGGECFAPLTTPRSRQPSAGVGHLQISSRVPSRHTRPTSYRSVEAQNAWGEWHGQRAPTRPPPVTALVPTPRPSATGASPLAHLSPQSPHPSSSMMISDAESDSKPSSASAPLEAGAATCVPPLLTRCRCVLLLVEAWELRLAAHFAISSVAFSWQAADTGLTPAAAVVACRRRSSVRVAERAPGAAGRLRCPWLCAASPGAPPMADRFTNSRHWPKKVGVCDSAASRLYLQCRASRPCSP